MKQNEEKINADKFHIHFDRVLRRIEKRYDNNKNYSDGRHSWPITGWKWSDNEDSVLIAFGYGNFVIVFQYEKSAATFKAWAQVDTHVPFSRININNLIEPSKSVVEFDLEITEPSEARKEPVLGFRQGVKNEYMIGPDEMRLFGELVREFIHHESCRELNVNFEVVIEYVSQQTACRKVLEMAQAALDRQFEEIKIAWPAVTKSENRTP